MSEAIVQRFAIMPHRGKQIMLAKLPFEHGGSLLDQLYGHEYDGFIHRLIPEYCKWSYLNAGGEPEAIVEAGRAGRLYGMERIAADPFNFYTSGSPGVIQAEIVISTKTLHRAVIRYGWQENQRQELRYPSVSLDALLETPAGDYLSLNEVIADPTQPGDPVAEIISKDALRAALSRLTPDTREMFGKWLSGKELAMIAEEYGEDYGTVKMRIWRAKQVMREELTRRMTPGFDE